MSSEAFFDEMKAENFPDKYMDKFSVSYSPRDPLLNVVPLDVDDFFGTKVCNVICFTGLYYQFDPSVTATAARLAAVFNSFAKYETHFIVDGDATKIASATGTQLGAMESEFLALISQAPGLFWHGVLSGDELQATLLQIVNDFYS